MSADDYDKIAMAVIVAASEVDSTFEKHVDSDAKLRAKINGWGQVFRMAKAVWPREALEAVYVHYGEAGAFPIKPGDVVAYCKSRPVTSSREHISWWLDRWAQHPWSDAIQEAVGRPIPQLEPDSSDVADKPRLIEQRRAFINEQRDFFIDQILANAERKAITR